MKDCDNGDYVEGERQLKRMEDDAARKEEALKAAILDIIHDNGPGLDTASEAMMANKFFMRVFAEELKKRAMLDFGGIRAKYEPDYAAVGRHLIELTYEYISDYAENYQ